MPELQIGPFALAYLSRYPQDAAQILTGGDARSIADLLGRSMPALRAEQVAAVLAALPTPIGSESLALLPAEMAAAVLPTLSIDQIAEIVTPLSVVTSRRLLSTLRPAALAGVRRTLNYAPDSVGKNMQTHAVTLPAGISVAAARAILPTGRADTPAVAFILDSQRQIKGIVSLHEIAAANDNTELDSLVRPAPPALKANQHLAEVRLLPIWRDHRHLPVVGAQGRFLGVLERIEVLEAFVDTDSSTQETDRDPIDLLLSIAETVWIPLAHLFGTAARPQHPYIRPENRKK